MLALAYASVLVAQQSAPSVESQAPEKPLSIQQIFGHGPLIGKPPDELTWSPDGKHLTYLDGGELIDLDPGTGKPHVLVSRAKMASLAKARRLRAGPRPSRALQHGQLHLGAGLRALLFDSERPAVALRPAQRHRRSDRLYRHRLRRRSQVLARRPIHLLRPRPWPLRHRHA